MDGENGADYAPILRDARTIAVVGLSPNPQRPSHEVAAYLQAVGYHIIPVNPTVAEVLGERSYASLGEVPERVDVVDIFRRAQDVPPLVEQAARIGARVVWMQEGVINHAAADAARAAGMTVVMDRCMLKEHQRLRAGGRL